MRKIKIEFALFFILVVSANAGLEVFQGPYDPHNPPLISLENQQGKRIDCKILDFSPTDETIRIQLEGTGRKLWMSPTLLSPSDRAFVSEYRTIHLIHEFTMFRAKRSNRPSKSATYDIEIRNLSRLALTDLELESRLYVKRIGTSELSYRSKHEHFDKIDAGERLQLESAPIAIRKVKTVTREFSMDVFTGKSHKTMEKRESDRDNLKGLVLLIRYKGVTVREWYSDPTLEKVLRASLKT